MTKSFECQTYGKWILAGEHAVLRGGRALVFPLRSQSFLFQSFPDLENLTAEFCGAAGSQYNLLFWGVLENALERLQIPRQKLLCRFRLTSNLPVGAGLGASGALCAAVAYWCETQGFLGERSVYEFARDLENLFHGESSGVDVAVALRGRPLIFARGQEWTELTPTWQPQLYLSYSGHRGMTSDCVSKVKKFIDKSPEFGRQLDHAMGSAVDQAIEALQLPSEKGFPLLQKAMVSANDCFLRWGLVTSEVQEHMAWLKSQGAQAVKPTGSGGGGFVLSLWQQAKNISETFTPCF